MRTSRLYSEELGIDVWRGVDGELFKWFLASLLFGARISETIAKRTYRAFERHHLLQRRKIVKAGWDYLVNPIMREGGYVRYDEKTSTKILRCCETLRERYGGSLNRLHATAEDPSDLEDRVMSFYGVGPVTANIFLRELRPVWEKCDPEPLPVVAALARACRIDLRRFNRRTEAFIRIEAGLIRMRTEKDSPLRAARAES